MAKRNLFRIFFLVGLLLSHFPAVSAQSPLENLIPPIAVNLNGTPAPGYIFLTPSSQYNFDQYPSSLFVGDSAGNPIYVRPFEYPQGSQYKRVGISDFKPLGDGRYVYNLSNTGGSRKILLDSAFQLLDSVKCIGLHTDSHDFTLDQDGNYCLLCLDYTQADLSALTTIYGIPGSDTAEVISGKIQVLSPSKQLLKTWTALDHYDVEDVDEAFFESPDQLDFTHFNTLRVVEDGSWLVGARNLHEVSLINAATGDFIWRMGGKKNEFALEGDSIFFHGQHDPYFLDNGDLLVFDNGLFSPVPRARSVRFSLDVPQRKAKLEWQYTSEFNEVSLFIGNSQELAGGNQLINWGGLIPFDSRPQIIEVSPDSGLVMEITLPKNYLSYRVYKASPTYKIPRPLISCDPETGGLKIESDAPLVEWSTGSRDSILYPTSSGTYSAWVFWEGGYLKTEEFLVIDPAEPCPEVPSPDNQLVLVAEAGKLSVELLGNPGPVEVECFDQLGRRVMKTSLPVNGRSELSLESLPAGMYILRCSFAGGEKVWRVMRP